MIKSVMSNIYLTQNIYNTLVIQKLLTCAFNTSADLIKQDYVIQVTTKNVNRNGVNEPRAHTKT